MELRFDYSDGDYCFDMGGNMMMDSDRRWSSNGYGIWRDAYC